MAQVQFPSGPANGATYTVNNVIYTWSAANSLWTANNSSDLNSLFVAVAGDTMTGDLVANTTGALTLPDGTDAERPATPTDGMVRFNTDPASTIGDRLEVYESGLAKWLPLEYAVPLAVLPDYTVTNGEALAGLIECANFIVPAGVTATVVSAVIVKCTGGATIDGTLDGNGLGVLGATPFYTVAYQNLYVGPGFGLGGGSTTVGGRPYAPQASLVGSGGAGGFLTGNQVSGTVGGYGGASGATFAIEAVDPIVVAGTISMNGSNGFISDRTAPIIITGPGGGSGGGVFLVSNANVTNTGTINANGGNGENPHNGGVGGGGGGGGWVILESKFGTATTGTTSVNGGNGGVIASATTGGGGGGAFAGYGGNGSIATAGGVGIVTTSGAPLF